MSAWLNTVSASVGCSSGNAISPVMFDACACSGASVASVASVTSVACVLVSHPPAHEQSCINE